MDDNKIIELFFMRSESAIAALAEKYGGQCHGVAANILNNEQDAEECVNDAYLAAWNTIPPQKPNPLRTYVLRLVRNISIKRYHYNKAQCRNSKYDVAFEELAACIPGGCSAEDEYDAARLTEHLNAFLATLDDDNRVMFVRRYWYSESVGEIAARFGVRPHYVTVRLSRLRAKLKAYLQKEGIAV